MFEYKALLGIIAVILAFAGYIPYFRDLFLGKTKPHAYTEVQPSELFKPCYVF